MQVLHRGSGWGRLHELLLHAGEAAPGAGARGPPPPLTPGLEFRGGWGPAETPFAELLRDGTFSEVGAARKPGTPWAHLRKSDLANLV